MRKREKRALAFALQKTDALIAASLGDESTCAVFKPMAGHTEPFTERQMQAVRLYVDSWIREPLAAAIAGLNGERDWENERYLESFDRYVEPTAEDLKAFWSDR
jgi:hypothetical protein